jgi:cytochrome P450
MTRPIPIPNNRLSLKALLAMRRDATPLAALEVFHEALGPVFQARLPGFSPVMMAGAEAAEWVLITHKADLRWRTDADPISRLLRNGLLVTDGELHDAMRKVMNPAVHRRALGGYVDHMWRCTDEVLATWRGRDPLDMLVEMRKVALLITIETLFGVDFSPELERLWGAVLKTIHYIAPGLWMLWADVPRPGYAQALRQIDAYLRAIIRLRRQQPGDPTDMLGLLIHSPGVDDDMVRDQLLTMIVAGHDTVTAMLAWALYLLAKHPEAQAQARDEVQRVLGDAPPSLDKLNDLSYLGRVIDEAMRLYPPAHLGSRVATRDLPFGDYLIRAGARVTYSIYVTQRMSAYWPQPTVFDPDRFLPDRSRGRPAFSYIPFGGGQRICIGTAYALVEAKIVLARVLQSFTLTLLRPHVHGHMGATLEPRPGVIVSCRPC